jgi:hypothetical protein
VPTTIADLWLLTNDNRPADIRSPLFSSRQIEGEVKRANLERRGGRTDWTAIDLEEVILAYLKQAAELASGDEPTQQTDQLPLNTLDLGMAPAPAHREANPS